MLLQEYAFDSSYFDTVYYVFCGKAASLKSWAKLNVALFLLQIYLDGVYLPNIDPCASEVEGWLCNRQLAQYHQH